MMSNLSFFNKLVFLFTILVVGLLLLSCIVPYTSIASLSFLSLGVPLLVIINILLFVYWLFKKNKIFYASGLALLVGYFALGSFVEFGNEKVSGKDADLSVLSYNVMGFNKPSQTKKVTVFDEIKIFVDTEQPDIICFQESGYLRRKEYVDYPYQYLKYINNRSRVLLGIFSKYPIINANMVYFPNSANSASFADMVINNDTVRVYNLHLESLNIRPGMIKREQSDKLFKRLSYSFSKQHEQAEIIRKHSDVNSFKKIVCGDFNNTQFSNVYRIIKDDMQDTFTEKGSGYGKTLNFWRFPLRIDFILADPEFEVLSHENFELKLSDHEPIMASFNLKTNK